MSSRSAFVPKQVNMKQSRHVTVTSKYASHSIQTLVTKTTVLPLLTMYLQR